MRVLLDENLPRALAAHLGEHDVRTVQAEGWAGTKNGELLQRAESHFDALLTMDRGLPHQQKLGVSGLRIVIIRAQSNRMIHLTPLVDTIEQTLAAMPPGELREVGD